MKRLQAWKFELRTSPEAESRMRRFAGACRYVYNQALALQQEFYAETSVHPGYVDLSSLLKEWRTDELTPWLAESPFHTLQQSLRNLESAWQRHFDSLRQLKAGNISKNTLVGQPAFKKKGVRDSFRYPDPKQIKLDQASSRIFLPKLGWLRYRNSREVQGDLRNVTVSRNAGRWFVAIQTEREVVALVHQSTSAIGIDVGVVRLATLSDGSHVDPVNSFQRLAGRLHVAQIKLARKKKFSKNWKKAKAKIQTLHSRIARTRQDYLHKVTSAISKNHAMAVVEDLAIRNMTASAAGTVEQPGTNVRQKAGLNRAILDQGWGEFYRQLEYKMLWAGGTIVSVPPQNTSRTCPECGHISAENRTTQAVFLCVECGFTQNADWVAARNILRAGHARSASHLPATTGRPGTIPIESCGAVA